jgi:DnaJ-class molecular chaperone
MSDTPETNALVDKFSGKSVTMKELQEWISLAEKLEKERDAARKQVAQLLAANERQMRSIFKYREICHAHANEAVRARDEAKRLRDLLRVSKCPNCDGSGVIPVQTSARQLVTREMALDACCPELEGTLYSDDEWEQQPCQWCEEKSKLLKEGT